jgi:tetratricopeptide (TPR) repeat protein
MSSKEENSDFTYLGKRIDKALNYVQTNKPGLIEWFKEYIETPYLNIIYGELELEEEDYTFDYLDSLLDDIEEKFNIIFETKQIMSNEFKRMIELAGLPITETTTEENTTETLNENFVGIPAINNVFEREKTDYELAFEHFTKGTSILEDYDKASQEMEEESLHQEESEELEEASPLEGGPGYMTKNHAGVLARLISDLESEDTSNFSESNLKNYEEALSNLKTALEATKAKYREETGTSLNEELEEDVVKGPNVKKVDGKWRVLSGKTGKMWSQTYDSKTDAEDAIKAYHASK